MNARNRAPYDAFKSYPELVTNASGNDTARE